MAVLVLFFSLIYLRDTSSGKFRILVIPSPGSVVMDTEYEGEATVVTDGVVTFVSAAAGACGFV